MSKLLSGRGLRWLIILATGLWVLSGCGAGTLRPPVSVGFSLQSDFAPETTIPLSQVSTASGGRNVSPPLSWRGVPVGTKSLVLTVVDHALVAQGWVHWLVINLPGSLRALPAGVSRTVRLPAPARELPNSFGAPGYGGPQPPPGTGRHPYIFTLYALKVSRLSLPPDADIEAVQAVMSGQILGQASLTGYRGD